jgi:hypothetical protein
VSSTMIRAGEPRLKREAAVWLARAERERDVRAWVVRVVEEVLEEIIGVEVRSVRCRVREGWREGRLAIVWCWRFV